eukprot:symbB.v1.2.033740.t1/scaffold4019.1/size63226/8
MAATPSAPSSLLNSFRQRFPDKALLVSGAVGGPTVIWLCTPLRNGLTLGAKDGETFDRGILEESDHGWRTKNPALLVSTERFSVAVCTLVGQVDLHQQW